MFRSHCAILVALLSISTDALNAQVCRTASVPVTPTNWNQALAVPRFDPAVGTLVAVHVQFAVHEEGGFGLENLDPGPVPVQFTFSAGMTLVRPDNSVILGAQPTVLSFFTLAPFDGVVDLAGPSGIAVSGLSFDIVPSPTITLNSAADLALFTGPTGNPGTASLHAVAQGTSSASGPGSLGVVQVTMRASCVVTVCYAYSQAVTPFCIGTNLACPCSNGGFNGGGCASSASTWGATLIAEGTPSVGADSLSLLAVFEPASASTLFFQGTTRVNGGLGAPFGDGLRCADGTIRRIGVKTASAGTAGYPGVGDAPVSVRGGVVPGDVRMYQAWYRDVATYCTADAFNLTQGLEVRWVL